VTGEEKRVPPRARYFIATVEAMPLDREVDFVAIDEIQLAAHPERGHVFTDRLLRARGPCRNLVHGLGHDAPVAPALAADHRGPELPRLVPAQGGSQPLASRVPPRSAGGGFSILQGLRAGRTSAAPGGAERRSCSAPCRLARATRKWRCFRRGRWTTWWPRTRSGWA
jgi:hypothetical protein